jgi:histidinol dehydrogenase
MRSGLGFGAMLKVLDLRGLAPGERPALPRPDVTADESVGLVQEIIAAVREGGDGALRAFTGRFDRVALDELSVSLSEAAAARRRIEPVLLDALTEAGDRIEAFHRHRPLSPLSFERAGVSVERLDLPVERAAAYVPGGRARYPSSVLMTAIPAKVAGVDEVVLCVPPGPDGLVPDEVLAAAAIAGVDEIYRVGGAQAIAALAYGTETIRPVDVIAGAGSRWVSIAKEEVRGVVGVPAAFAGPSEVVVVADDTVLPELAAIDVVVQAEHGPDGLAWLVTWSETALEAINTAIGRFVEHAPRQAEITSTLLRGGCAVLVDGPGQAMAVANEIAPEHLELLCDAPDDLVTSVRNAGAVFIGPSTPASLGDYLAGPSHVLPTFRSARFASALGVEDFLRRVHVVKAEAAGLRLAAPHVRAIAEAEGLFAHAESVSVRVRRTP